VNAHFGLPAAHRCIAVLILCWGGRGEGKREKGVRAMKKLFEALSEIDVLLLPKQYAKKMLQAICDNLGYRFGTVIEIDEGGKGGLFVSYNLPEDYVERVNQAKVSVLSTPSGEATETGRVVVVHNPSSEPRLAPWYDVLRPYNLKTIVWVPLLSKGHAFGTYVLYDTQIRDISEAELQVFEQIAVMVSIAISSNHYIDQLNQKTKELEDEITEHKRAKETLQKERDRAKMYLDVAGVLLVVIGADQKVYLINKKGCEILGYYEKEIIGKNWFDTFIPERNREEVKAVFEQLMAGEIEPVEYFENHVLTNSGGEKIIAWHNSVLKDEKGEITASLSSGEDITERKRVEEELQKYMAELEGFNRLAVGRELKMIELKREVNGLCKRIGEKPRYDLSFVDAEDEIGGKKDG